MRTKKPKWERDKKTGVEHFHDADRRAHFLYKRQDDIYGAMALAAEAEAKRQQEKAEQAFDWVTDFLPGGSLGGIVQDAIDSAKDKQNLLQHGINPDTLRVIGPIKALGP